jgi:hypothetical protein
MEKPKVVTDYNTWMLTRQAIVAQGKDKKNTIKSIAII